MRRIDRIKAMEARLDKCTEAVNALSEAAEKYFAAREDLVKLSEYYGSSLWLRDFEADEAGKLPADLKRGVLSEDAVYDLLTGHRELMAALARAVAGSIEDNI